MTDESKHGDLSYKESADYWHALSVVVREDADKLRRQISGLSQANREAHAGIAARREREAHLQSAIERRNAQIKDMSADYIAISLARDKAENERDIARTCVDALRGTIDALTESNLKEAAYTRKTCSPAECVSYGFYEDTRNKLSEALSASVAARDIANAEIEALRRVYTKAVDELESMRMERDLAQAGECVIGFEALAARIEEADRKHPRDLHDERVQPFARNKLDDARFDLANFPSWARVLKCEVAEALHALAAESPERLADELLDVATVALRWRRAILERTKTGE